MRQRLRKIDRILKVQQQIHKIAEVRLAGLQRQSGELKEMQKTLIETMNDHEAFHGLFVDTMAKRLQVLATQAAWVETARVAQAKIALERAMQVKRTEKVASDLEVESRRATEKKELLAVLETHSPKSGSPKPDASFP